MAINIYRNELNRIRSLIETFYATQFASSEEEFETNRKNKQQIGQLIVRMKQADDLPESEQQHWVKEALRLLTKNTGCAEDGEIAEQILDSLLFDLKVVHQKDIDGFYQFTATGRWS